MSMLKKQSQSVNTRLRLMLPMLEMAAVQLENIKTEQDLINLQRMLMSGRKK